jgi:hypothetical protein
LRILIICCFQEANEATEQLYKKENVDSQMYEDDEDEDEDEDEDMEEVS